MTETSDGMAHLQRAAKELIAAGRAFLDAADEIVDDPASLSQIGDAVGTLAKLAGSALGTVSRAAAPDGDDDGDDEPRVQRIRVS